MESAYVSHRGEGQMNQQQMIEAAASELTLGLDGAAQYVYDWVSSHPDAALATLCKKVADKAGVPDSWKALEGRVTRKRAKAANQADSSTTSTESDKAAVRHTRRVLRGATEQQIEDLVGDLPPEKIEALASAAHKAQMKKIRASAAAADEPLLTHEDEQRLRERHAEIEDNSTIEMAELFSALSRVRVKGIEKLVANASARERREWQERLPEEIALLQFALDLCKTRKLEAVNG